MKEYDAYHRGRTDHALGVPRNANPYDDHPDYGTQDWEIWFEGWDDAEEEQVSILRPPKPNDSSL
jgi:hypothetical protein